MPHSTSPAGLPPATPLPFQPPVIYRIDRRRLRKAGDGELVPGGPTAETLIGLFDREGLPDKYPFIMGASASVDGADHVNKYLLNAFRDRAYKLRPLSAFHATVLRRFLEFLWERAGRPVEMTTATTNDLVAYKEKKLQVLQSSSWDTEIGCLGSFFSWAQKSGLMATDPIPRWGTRGRNTLVERVADYTTPKFLQDNELHFFLSVGLRGDNVFANRPVKFLAGVPPKPAGPIRGFTFAHVQATTGLRREEAARLLDVEVPTLSQENGYRPKFFGSDTYQFICYGKGGKPRAVHMLADTAAEIDVYRDGERKIAIDAAQSSLKKRIGVDLLIVDEIRVRSGKAQVYLGDVWRAVDRLSSDERARLVSITEHGRIEPLGLFVTRSGLPPALNAVNEWFANANERLAACDHPYRPSIHVSTHTMRHSFAVQTLAALMQQPPRLPGNPYALVMNPVFTIQLLLGHSDLKTTYRYLMAAEHYGAVPEALQRRARSIREATTQNTLEPDDVSTATRIPSDTFTKGSNDGS